MDMRSLFDIFMKTEKTDQKYKLNINRRAGYAFLFLLLTFSMIFMTGCTAGRTGQSSQSQDNASQEQSDQESDDEDSAGGRYPYAVCTGEEQTEYADKFRIYDYEDDIREIVVNGTDHYIVIGSGSQDENDISDQDISVDADGVTYNIIILPQNNIYLAASSGAAFFSALDAVDQISAAGILMKDWYVDDMRDAMQNGDILYTGKYSAPDFETMLQMGCSLAIESTMINHSPEVKEKLISNGIQVFTDYQNYEKSPLGKLEWIKVYGILTEKYDKAVKIFDEEKNKYLQAEEESQEAASSDKKTESAVFFYINSQNEYVVRCNDYIQQMMEEAGFKYLPDNIDDNGAGYVKMSEEAFYAACHDADVMIWDGAIIDAPESVEQLQGLSTIFDDFKAVKEDRVYSVSRSYYQRNDRIAELFEDFKALSDGDQTRDMEFLKKLQ